MLTKIQHKLVVFALRVLRMKIELPKKFTRPLRHKLSAIEHDLWMKLNGHVEVSDEELNKLIDSYEYDMEDY